MENRFKPERWFLLFRAYFDEADTHGAAPTVILAGFLGTGRQWELFERRLRVIQNRDGFNIFHGTDFKTRSGAFRGWSDAKSMRLVDDLTELVRDQLTEGVVVHLERDRYMAEYRAPPVPRGMTLDSQYGLCFRAAIAHMVGILIETKKKHRLHIVLEQGHKNVRDSTRIFAEVKRRLKERRGIDLLGDITIATKEEAPPLMLSDFLAGTFSMMRKAKAAGGSDYTTEAGEPRKRDAGLTFLEFAPDALRQLKTDFEADRQEQAAAWRARKEASRAAYSRSPSPVERPS